MTHPRIFALLLAAAVTAQADNWLTLEFKYPHGQVGKQILAKVRSTTPQGLKLELKTGIINIQWHELTVASAGKAGEASGHFRILDQRTIPLQGKTTEVHIVSRLDAKGETGYQIFPSGLINTLMDKKQAGEDPRFLDDTTARMSADKRIRFTDLLQDGELDAVQLTRDRSGAADWKTAEFIIQDIAATRNGLTAEQQAAFEAFKQEREAFAKTNNTWTLTLSGGIAKYSDTVDTLSIPADEPYPAFPNWSEAPDLTLQWYTRTYERFDGRFRRVYRLDEVEELKPYNTANPPLTIRADLIRAGHDVDTHLAYFKKVIESDKETERGSDRDDAIDQLKWMGREHAAPFIPRLIELATEQFVAIRDTKVYPRHQAAQETLMFFADDSVVPIAKSMADGGNALGFGVSFLYELKEHAEPALPILRTINDAGVLKSVEEQKTLEWVHTSIHRAVNRAEKLK